MRRLSQEHLKRFALRESTHPAAEQSTAVKADAAVQFKVGKTMTERAAEDAGVEALKVKHDACRKVATNANTSVTTITVKAERSGLSETEQAVTDKAEEIKATEEKSVSSVVESVPKHETVHEVTFDRTAAALQDAHRDQMMEEVEALTKTANETMKEANITTETGESENVRKVGVEKASTPIEASTHESATDDDGMSNTVSASVPLERGQPMTNQAETQKTRTVAMRRQEQLGVSSSEEHKTFHKTSRWGYSRAATGRGAGRARCRLARARERAEKDSFNDNRLFQTCRLANQYTHV